MPNPLQESNPCFLAIDEGIRLRIELTPTGLSRTREHATILSGRAKSPRRRAKRQSAFAGRAILSAAPAAQSFGSHGLRNAAADRTVMQAIDFSVASSCSSEREAPEKLLLGG